MKNIIDRHNYHRYSSPICYKPSLTIEAGQQRDDYSQKKTAANDVIYIFTAIEHQQHHACEGEASMVTFQFQNFCPA